MKKSSILYFILIVAFLGLISCSDDNSTDPNVDYQNLNIPDGFNWTNLEYITLNISLEDANITGKNLVVVRHNSKVLARKFIVDGQLEMNVNSVKGYDNLIVEVPAYNFSQEISTGTKEHNIAVSLTLALGPNGMLLRFFGIENLNIYGFLGTWLSESLTYFPVAFMVISAVLNTMNASLDDAAMSLGASKSRVLKTVTLPLSIPAIGNSILLLFSSSLADFATPLILGGQSFPVLPTQAYLQITGLFDIHGGASISFLLLVPALIVFWLQRMVIGNKSFVTVTGKNGAQSNFVKLPKSVSLVMWSICSIVIAFILYLYFIILWGSLIQTWGINNSLTLKNYKYVFTYGHKAITDTLKIGLVSTVLGTLLGVIIGYIVERKNFISKRALDIASMMNYALPGTVVGIAYIVAFNSKPFVLTGTMTILVAAYIFRYYATGIRSVMTSLQQIDPALEEASMSLGASSARTFTHVTVPLIIPAVLTGMRYLFIHCMTAISATIFLVSVRWTLLTTRILESMTELQFSQACAFSVILILIVFIADALMNFMLKTYSNHFKKNAKENQ